MKQFLLVLLGFSLFVGIVNAIPMHEWTLNDYLVEGFDSQGKLKPNYQHNLDVANSQLQNAPQLLRGLLLNESIQGEIQMKGDRVELIGVELTQKGIEKLFRGQMANPTMRVQGDEQSIIAIMESDSPVDIAVQELNEGKITYEAVSSPSASDAAKVESSVVITTKLFFVNVAAIMNKFMHNVYVALSG